MGEGAGGGGSEWPRLHLPLLLMVERTEPAAPEVLIVYQPIHKDTKSDNTVSHVGRDGLVLVLSMLQFPPTFQQCQRSSGQD